MKTHEEWELNFDSAPFCNGSLHLGHVRNYVLGDVRARWLRKQGKNVSYRSAFDTFGIPNEEGARRAGSEPHVYVAAQAERIDRQFKALGLSYSTYPLPQYSSPDYYRWTQWLFLELWKLGLVYRENRLLPYCAVCNTFLAATQIQNDLCWRCSTAPLSRQSDQWFIRTTDYADRLYEGIERLSGWSERAKNVLKSSMGRLVGRAIVVIAELPDCNHDLNIFTTGEQQWPHVRLAIRSDHPLVSSVFPDNSEQSILGTKYRRSNGRRHVCRPFSIQVDDVLMTVVPYPSEHIPEGFDAIAIPLDTVPIEEEIPVIRARTISSVPRSVFRVQNWMVSRNRTWGTPLPAVDCPDCGISPVAECDLPVRLRFHGGNGRAHCNQCGAESSTVSRVLDCFFDDTWCFYATAPNTSDQQNPFEAWRDNPPTKVHFHVGFDTFVYFNLFRFIGYVLFDLGYTPRPEPIDFLHGHDVVTADGKKMSKRHGNAPDLDILLEEWGRDVVRLSVLSNVNPGKTISWKEERLKHAAVVVSTIQDLSRRRPGSKQHGAGQSNLPTIHSIQHRLERVSGFIGSYRTGAALDQLRLATRELIRAEGSTDLREWSDCRREILDLWELFTPQTATTPLAHLHRS